MEQIKKISKLCDAKVKFTWPGFVEEADGGNSSFQDKKLNKKKKKGKKKQKNKEEPEEPEEQGEGGRKKDAEEEQAAAAKDTEEEKPKKKTKLECMACTHGHAPSNVRRAALWCCTRCALMCCGAMRMFVAAAGVLGLCLTMFFIFAPLDDATVKPN